MGDNNPTQQTFTCSKSTIEKLENGVKYVTCSKSTIEKLENGVNRKYIQYNRKYVQSYQQRHDIDIFIVNIEQLPHLFLVFLLFTLNM